MNCKERNFELITSISAFTDAEVSFSVPMNEHRKHLSKSELQFSGNGLSIPMEPKSASVKEASKEELPGTSYTVTVKWEVKELDEAAYAALERLRNGFFHLIINTFGDNSMLVHSNEDGYLFTYEENGGTLECELSILNINGVQRIL